MAERKLVEVFIDTDSDSESHTSSEVAVGSDNDMADTEDTYEEVGVVSEGEEPRELEMVPAALDSADSPFTELMEERNNDFALYEDIFGESPAQSPNDGVIEPTPDPTGDVSMRSVFAEESDSSEPFPSPPGSHGDDGSGSHGDDGSGSHGNHSDPANQPVTFSPQSPANSLNEGKQATPLLYCLCKDPQWDPAMIQCDSCHKHFHGSCVGISRLKAALLKHFYCPLCIDKEPGLVTEFDTWGERVEQKQAEGVKEPGTRKLKNKRHNRRCGECVACLNTEDCRQCKFCKDLPKYGGPGRARQKCIKRQCLFLSKILQQELAHAQELKLAGMEVGGDFLEGLLEGGGVASLDHEQNKIKPTAADTPQGQKKKQLGKRARPAPSKRGAVKKKAGSSRGTRPKKSRPEVEEIIRNAPSRRSRRPFSDLLAYSRDDFYKPTQCLGQGCTFETRPNSKYCSEECGIQLALERIRTYLPARKRLAGSAECMATQRNRARLKELEEEQKVIKNRLDQLDKQTTAINNHMTRISSCTPTEEEEVFEVESEDLTIHCASCSQPVTLKKAMVHLERCFNKVEGVVSFGSIVKNEGTTIFCDKYDSSQKTYCKRLKVLCPEHTKEPKIGPNEVCGCPFDPLFPSINKECRHFCEHPRKTCIKHYCWEKLRRAEIDQEKLNLYLKLEEVGEQTRLQQWQVDHRHSLLAIMYHHTVDHSKKSSWNGHPLGPTGEGEGRGRGDGGGEVEREDMERDELEREIAMERLSNVERDVEGKMAEQRPEGEELVSAGRHRDVEMVQERREERSVIGAIEEKQESEERVHWRREEDVGEIATSGR